MQLVWNWRYAWGPRLAQYCLYSHTLATHSEQPLKSLQLQPRTAKCETKSFQHSLALMFQLRLSCLRDTGWLEKVLEKPSWIRFMSRISAPESPGNYQICDFIWFYTISYDFEWFYIILYDFVGVHMILYDFTWFYKIL